MPPTLFPLDLILALVASLYLAIVLHELGHAISGSLAGLRVAACGLGYHRPLVQMRLFGICFFWARPFFGGLTLALSERLHPPRHAAILMYLGGPLANLLTAVILMAVWRLGGEHTFIVVLFYVSLVFAVVNIIPFKSRMGGATLASDGQNILDYFRTNYSQQWWEPGEWIRSATALRQLCADLKLDAARARFALVEAMSLAGVCDPETARETLVAETLDKIEHDPGLRRLESLTQAAIAVAETAPDVDQHLDQAEEACTGDAAAYCIVGLLRIVGLLDRGLPAADLARNIIEQAQALGRTDLETMARALDLEANPPDDLEQQCQKLLRAKGRRRLTPLTGVRLACAVTRILANRGQSRSAQNMFHEARSRLLTTAASISSEQTRNRFLTRASAPLRDAATAELEGPIFLSEKDVQQHGDHPASQGRRSRKIRSSMSSVSTFVIAASLGIIVSVGAIIYLEEREIAKRNPLPGEFDEDGALVGTFPELTDAAADLLNRVERDIGAYRDAVLLLTMLNESPVLATVIDHHDLDDAQLRTYVEHRLERAADLNADRSRQTSGTNPPHSLHRVAFEQALELQHRSIDQEHLMLALLSKPGGVTEEAFRTVGADPNEVRQTILAMLPEPPND